MATGKRGKHCSQRGDGSCTDADTPSRLGGGQKNLGGGRHTHNAGRNGAETHLHGVFPSLVTPMVLCSSQRGTACCASRWGGMEATGGQWDVDLTPGTWTSAPGHPGTCGPIKAHPLPKGAPPGRRGDLAPHGDIQPGDTKPCALLGWSCSGFLLCVSSK